MAITATARDLVFDPWTPMASKRVLGGKRQPGDNLAPTWVGDLHSRRLTAYKILASYLDNASRFFREFVDAANDGVRGEAEADDYREYGDPALLRNQAMSALLGEQWEIAVDGADGYDPEADDNDTEATQAWEQQEWVRAWADKERFGLKLLETERNAVGLGDGVYVLGINPRRKRVRLRTFDPGFYFPVLDDNDDDEYPDVVHLAWEVVDAERPNKLVVRRITWRLVETPEAKTYPYADEPSNLVCLMSDGVWELDRENAKAVEDFSDGAVQWAVWTDPATGEVQEFKDVDIGLDFIPVVHIPNTVALADHFGRSLISGVLQILDDLINADTDLQASSATTGKPPIALSGVRMDRKPTYRAGAVWTLGENGKLSTVDTSAAIKALMEYVVFLLRRLSVNSRIPEEILGRLQAEGDSQMSGVSRRMKNGPLESLVREMRLVRTEKYALLFKMVWRMSMVAGFDKVPAEWSGAELQFGSYLPADEQAIVDLVVKLLQEDAIALETALKMLAAAGVPIADANEEVLLIQYRDFEGANQLLDATGDPAQVLEYLGIQGTTPAAADTTTAPVGTTPEGAPTIVPVTEEPLPGERGEA